MNSSLLSSQSSTLQQQSQTILAQSSSIQSQSSALLKDQKAITALEANITATEAALRQSQSEVANTSTLQAQVTSLQGQIAVDTARITTLVAQIDTLTSITALTQSSVELSQQLIPVPSIGDQVAATFTANYSGYVTVRMTTISDINNVQVGAIIFFAPSVESGQYTSQPLGPFSYTAVPDSLVFPVTPGSITIYLANSASIPENATLTVTYHY